VPAGGGRPVSGTNVAGWPAGLETAAGGPDRTSEPALTEFLRALLPAGLPVFPRLEIAARYLALHAGNRSGAGWFDAQARSDGTAALTVGDTVGDGISAVAAMGQLRAALSERLGAGADLISTHAMAGEFAARTAGLAGATMALGLLDPEDGRLRYLTLGNPPPLVLRAGVTHEFLDGSEHGPVGCGGTPDVSSAQLRSGDVVLLFSLGLIQRPGRTIAEGLAEVGQAAAAAAADRGRASVPASGQAERVCLLADELLSRTGYTRDAAILAAELRAQVPRLAVAFPADIGSLRPARAQFREWLTAAGAPSTDVEDLQLAVGEIMTNAIVHAYPSGSRGRVELRADLHSDGILECQVADNGRWQTPDVAAAHGGNGLMVASRMAGRLRIRHPQGHDGAGGTVVTLRHKLSRPAAFRSVAGAVSADREQGIQIAVTGLTVAGVAAEVGGSVDDGTAERLLRRLLAACRGGTLSLIVDLSRVTYLDSAGVWALCQLEEQLSAHGRHVTVVAPRSGRAHPMLELAGVPHQADTRPAAGEPRSDDG
jgi:anti-sigma regulatory factor (Ser/Thr protein kinase)/anti-anti-sigma regulatory factor